MFLGNKNKYSINVFYLSILLRYFHLFVFRKTSFEVKFLIFEFLKNFIIDKILNFKSILLNNYKNIINLSWGYYV